MNRKIVVIMATLTMLLAFGACKHSGTALTAKAQAVNVDIDAPRELAEGETGTVSIDVRNIGLNNLSNTIIQVEFPSELSVLSENHGAGMRVMEGISADGNMMYQYDVGDIEVTQNSKANFEVRARFGTRNRSGEIKVLVWNEDLPGQRLLETKAIDMKR
ncbi:MAG: hypothetical protein KY459_16205 [Acidobacteria bacterium]|nr:hypothetical protein [Acidobacteriota bacterium]